MCYKKTFNVDVNAFLPQNLMILKVDISKTSTGRYIFLFIFICGNSKCTRIQKIKKFSGEVNWVLLALRPHLHIQDSGYSKATIHHDLSNCDAS